MSSYFFPERFKETPGADQCRYQFIHKADWTARKHDGEDPNVWLTYDDAISFYRICSNEIRWLRHQKKRATGERHASLTDAIRFVKTLRRRYGRCS